MGRRWLALSLAASLVAGPALAQEPTSAPGVFTFTPLGRGDPLDGKDTLAPFVAVTPLRLSLASQLFPDSLAIDAGSCGARTDASGNSIHGFPVQRYTLLRLTPNLVLHGFSTAGCPLDAAIGGAATYTVPLRKDLWLVGSAGVYQTIDRGPLLPARKAADVRVDLLKKVSPTTALGVGVGRRGLFFSGSF